MADTAPALKELASAKPNVNLGLYLNRALLSEDVTPKDAAKRAQAEIDKISGQRTAQNVAQALKDAKIYADGTSDADIQAAAEKLATAYDRAGGNKAASAPANASETVAARQAKTEQSKAEALDALQKGRQAKLGALAEKLDADLTDIRNPHAAVRALVAHPNAADAQAAWDAKTWKEQFGYEPKNDDETVALNELARSVADTKDGMAKAKAYEEEVSKDNFEYGEKYQLYQSEKAKTQVETAVRAGLNQDEKALPEIKQADYESYFTTFAAVDPQDKNRGLTRIPYGTLKQDEMGKKFDSILESAAKDVNLGSALAVIVDEPERLNAAAAKDGVGALANEDLWRGLGYQPDGRFDDGELKQLALLALRCKYSPEFKAFVTAKLAGLGDGAKASDDARKDLEKFEKKHAAGRLFAELGIKASQEKGKEIDPEDLNLQSAVDTTYAYVTRYGAEGKRELSENEWDARGYDSNGFFGKDERRALNALLGAMYGADGKVDATKLAILGRNRTKPSDKLPDGALEAAKEMENLSPETKRAMKLLADNPEHRGDILAKLGFTKEAVKHFEGRDDRLEIALQAVFNGKLTAQPALGDLDQDAYEAMGLWYALYGSKEIVTGKERKALPGTVDVLNGMRNAMVMKLGNAVNENANRTASKLPELPILTAKETLNELALYLDSPEKDQAFQRANGRRDGRKAASADRFDQTAYLAAHRGERHGAKADLAEYLADFNLDDKADGSVATQTTKGEKTIAFTEKVLYNGLANNLTEQQLARAPFILAKRGGLNLQDEKVRTTYGLEKEEDKINLETVTLEQSMAFVRKHPAIKPYIDAALATDGVAAANGTIDTFLKGASDQIDAEKAAADAKLAAEKAAAEAKLAAEKAAQEAKERKEALAGIAATVEALEKRARDVHATITEVETALANADAEALWTAKENVSAAAEGYDGEEKKITEAIARIGGKAQDTSDLIDRKQAAWQSIDEDVRTANAAEIPEPVIPTAATGTEVKAGAAQTAYATPESMRATAEIAAAYAKWNEEARAGARKQDKVANDAQTVDLKDRQESDRQLQASVTLTKEQNQKDIKAERDALEKSLQTTFDANDIDFKEWFSQTDGLKKAKNIVLKKYDAETGKNAENVDAKGAQAYAKGLAQAALDFLKPKDGTRRSASDLADLSDALPGLNDGIAQGKALRQAEDAATKAKELAGKTQMFNGHLANAKAGITAKLDMDFELNDSPVLSIQKNDKAWTYGTMAVQNFVLALQEAKEIKPDQYRKALEAIGKGESPTLEDAWKRRKKALDELSK